MPRRKVAPKRNPAVENGGPEGKDSKISGNSTSSSSSTKKIVRIRHKKGMARMDVDGTTTVKGLKSKIRDTLKVPMNRQKLLVGKIALERESKLILDLVEHGDIITLEEVASKRKSNPTESKGPTIGSRKKTKTERKKKKKKKADEPEIYGREGETAEDIATCIRAARTAIGQAAIDNVGERVFMQTMRCCDVMKEIFFTADLIISFIKLREHRLSAARSDKFKITEILDPSEFTSMAVSRGQRFLSVSFSNGRKKLREVVAHYDEDTIKEIIREIIKSQSKKRASLKGSIHLIGAEVAAMFSPPLFWSVCHEYPSKNVQATFQELIGCEYELLKNEKEN